MTQSQNILQHLKKGRTINPLQALNVYGCMRLASRINDLRNLGHNISSELQDVKCKDGSIKSVSFYKLKK